MRHLSVRPTFRLILDASPSFDESCKSNKDTEHIKTICSHEHSSKLFTYTAKKLQSKYQNSKTYKYSRFRKTPVNKAIIYGIK